jgi:hypothetical protein
LVYLLVLVNMAPIQLLFKQFLLCPFWLHVLPIVNCSSYCRLKLRVWTKCGPCIDVRAGDMHMATKGKKVKSVHSNPRSDCQFNRHSVQVSCLQALYHIEIIH